MTTDHSAKPPQEESANQDEDSAQGESVDIQRSWQKSPERAAIRRMRYICIALALVPTLIALSLLGLRQVELGRQTAASETTAIDISNSVDTWNTRIQELRNQIGTDQSELSVSAGNFAASPEYADSLDKEISSIEDQISADQKSLSATEGQLSQAEQTRTDAITRLDDMTGVWLVGVAVMLAWTALLVLVYRLFQGEKARAYEDGVLLAKLAKSELEGDPFDLQVLWKANREQLTTYHRLVLNYASSSRQTTIITLTVGFTFLLVIAGISAFSNSIASAVASSVVAAAGTALTGFVANAVLRNADTSSSEVRAFFAHPIEVERVLTAERIISNMPVTAHDAAKLLIIQSLMSQAQSKDGKDGTTPGALDSSTAASN